MGGNQYNYALINNSNLSIHSILFFQGYDSDVEREKNMDYAKKTYEKSMRDTRGVKPNEQEYSDENRCVRQLRHLL